MDECHLLFISFSLFSFLLFLLGLPLSLSRAPSFYFLRHKEVSYVSFSLFSIFVAHSLLILSFSFTFCLNACLFFLFLSERGEGKRLMLLSTEVSCFCRIPYIDMFHVSSLGYPLNLKIANSPHPLTSQIRHYPGEGQKFFQVPRSMYRGAYFFIISSCFLIISTYYFFIIFSYFFMGCIYRHAKK